MSRAGLCAHCGRPDAPLDSDGYLDRHRRADWSPHVAGGGNEVCAGDGRPGEPCQHLVPMPGCRSGRPEVEGPDMYVSHQHYGPGSGHSHAVGQGHTGDITNPNATRHDGVEIISWVEHIRRYRTTEPAW
jgi:hypothetical protein